MRAVTMIRERVGDAILVLAALREDSERPPGDRIASATESSRRNR